MDAIKASYLYTMNSPLILFDGTCNFCNSTINFVIRKENTNVIKFTTLQSDKGQAVLKQFGWPTDDFKSFLFIENDHLYSHSTGALRVCKYLKKPWKWASIFLYLPKWLRDPFYNVVAKNRYKWFGTRDTCMIPTPEIRAKFL